MKDQEKTRLVQTRIPALLFDRIEDEARLKWTSLAEVVRQTLVERFASGASLPPGVRASRRGRSRRA